MTARLSLLDESAPESPWIEERSNPSGSTSEHAGASVIESTSFEQVPTQVYLADNHHPQWDSQTGGPPATAPNLSSSHLNDASHQGRRTNFEHLDSRNGAYTSEAAGSGTTPSSPQDLLEFEVLEPPGAPAVSSAKESTAANDTIHPDAPPNPPSYEATDREPPLPARPSPAGATEAPSAERSSQQPPIAGHKARRQQEQKSETYSIRHVNWADPAGRMRESPVLVQNRNGPCPLLALINALVLRAPRNAQLPIVKALQPREQISLGLLIQALFDELTTRLGPHEELPDIEALSRFLTMLHTGMNVNPRLTLVSGPSLYLL